MIYSIGKLRGYTQYLEGAVPHFINEREKKLN